MPARLPLKTCFGRHQPNTRVLLHIVTFSHGPAAPIPLGPSIYYIPNKGSSAQLMGPPVPNSIRNLDGI